MGAPTTPAGRAVWDWRPAWFNSQLRHGFYEFLSCWVSGAAGGDQSTTTPADRSWHHDSSDRRGSTADCPCEFRGRM